MPARNVSTIDANDAMQSSHSCEWRSNRCPATTPSVSSINAAVIPSSTETMLATSTTTARTAARWMGSTTTSFFSVRRRCRGHQPSKGRLGAALIALRRTLARVAATSARLPRSRGRGSPRTRPWRSSTSTSRKGSGRPLLCDRVQTLADLIHVAAEVVEPRQRRERLEAEDPLEQRRDLVADRAAGAVVAAGFRDQAPLDQIGDGRIGRHAADACDVRPCARPEVRDDRERLERRLRQRALHRPLEQPTARVGRLARRAKRPAACHPLEHDPRAPLPIPIGEQTARRLDPLAVVRRRLRELLDRERLRGDDEERLDRPRELVDRTRGDQAEWAIHDSPLSASGREILIGANEPACSIAISSARRRSKSAKKATAISTREKPSTAASKSTRERRASSERNRSTNCETGGNCSAMCASETCGGSAASVRSAAPSDSGSCGPNRRSGRGASGAGPSRKKREDSSASRADSHAAASFIRRYASRRRASSSAASSGSRSARSASSSKRP